MRSAGSTADQLSEKCGSTRCTSLKLKLKLKTKCHQHVRELPVSDSPWQSCLDSNTTLGANGEHGPLGRATDNHYRLPVPPHPPYSGFFFVLGKAEAKTITLGETKKTKTQGSESMKASMGE